MKPSSKCGALDLYWRRVNASIGSTARRRVDLAHLASCKNRREDLDQRIFRQSLGASNPEQECIDLATSEPGSSTSPLHRRRKTKPEQST